MQLDIQTSNEDGRTIVTLSGELDLAEAPGVEAALQQLEEGRPELIVLDLSGLRFMDSSGLRVVISADKRARAAGRRLAVVPGSERIRRVFRMTRVDEHLDFLDTPDAGTR
jgi:anti-anti-sigma factor